MIHSKGFKRYQLFLHIVLVIVSLIIILPLVLLFMSSISSEKALLVHGYSFFPKEFSLDAYRYILNNWATISQAYFITIVVTVVGTAANLLLCSTTGFALSIPKLPFRRLINFYVLFTMLFSGGLVPAYLMWTGTFHIKNTIWALILPNYLMSAMNVMLMRSYFMTSIPDAIYEAAKIDGASYFTIYYRIVLPVGKPIIIAMMLFAGLTYWNDWTNGLYYITKPHLLSIQTLLNKMVMNLQAIQANSAASASGAALAIPEVSVRMAIAFVALLPILVVYPFLQKYFANGIALGAVKG